MKDVLIGENRMSSDPIQECLQHPLPAGDHRCIFLRLRLLDSIVANCLFARYWWYDEGGIELRKIRPQRLELRIAVMRLRILLPLVNSDARINKKMLTPDCITYVI